MPINVFAHRLSWLPACLLLMFPLAGGAQVRFGVPVGVQQPPDDGAAGLSEWNVEETLQLIQEQREERRDRRERRRQQARERTIECSSYNRQHAVCPIGQRNRSARLVEKLSDKPCKEGRSWGWNDDSVWVAQGCRGLFAVDEGRR